MTTVETAVAGGLVCTGSGAVVGVSRPGEATVATAVDA
jgi:hypothetical protein